MRVRRDSAEVRSAAQETRIKSPSFPIYGRRSRRLRKDRGMILGSDLRTAPIANDIAGLAMGSLGCWVPTRLRALDGL